jgi:hypothetical protein
MIKYNPLLLYMCVCVVCLTIFLVTQDCVAANEGKGEWLTANDLEGSGRGLI